MRGPPEGGAMPSAWRHIPSCPGYMASDGGRIRNCSTGKLLFGERDKDGYRRVNLRVDAARVKRSVHRLVCEAFNGACPDGFECAHLDGNNKNNAATNLAWLPHAENNNHKRQHGTHQTGAKHPRAKLSVEQVEAIRASEVPSRKLAAEYGVNQSQIVRIKKGDRW